MGILIKITFSVALLSLLPECGTRRPVPETVATSVPSPPPFQAPKFPQPDLKPILDSIPPDASKEQMDRGLERLLAAFSKARSGDMQQFLDAILTVEDQPQIVASFINKYEKIPKTDHGKRLSTLGLLGEIQRPDAMPFLKKTIWTPLPKRQPAKEGLTLRDLEEMVQVKAVHGLGYLQNPEGDRALIEIMQRHESIAVKIAAIDSYMWNHGDTHEAAGVLSGLLERELHKFVERPRFHRGMDQQKFNEDLKAWQSKWGSH